MAGLRSYAVAGQRFLLPRADIADEELIRGLSQLGAEARQVTAYRTVPVSDSLSRVRQILLSRDIDVVTFTSSSTVSNLMAAFEGDRPAMDGIRVACIGPKTAEAATRAGLKVDIMARQHTIPGLVAAIEEHFGKET